MSKNQRGLLGLGGGMHSTEYHSIVDLIGLM